MSCSFGPQSLLSTAFTIDRATAGASNAMRAARRAAMRGCSMHGTSELRLRIQPIYLGACGRGLGRDSERITRLFFLICRRRRSQFRSGDNCTTKDFATATKKKKKI